MKYLENLPDGEYVYIIQDVDISNYYKIGRTKNVSQRMNTFGVKLPFKTEIVRVIPCDNSSSVERFLHNKFSSLRVNGEWFNLRSDDLLWIMQFNPTDIYKKKMYDVEYRHSTRVKFERKLDQHWEGGQYAMFSVSGSNLFARSSWENDDIQISWTHSDPPGILGKLRQGMARSMGGPIPEHDCSVETAKAFVAALIRAIEYSEAQTATEKKEYTA